MRPKVQLVTAVWGKSYIEGFLNLSMLSALAPGNLPALAEHTDLEYVILTARADEKVFHRTPQFERLKAVANVRFIYIDDIIVKQIYGVVLTLAYFRAIKQVGEKARETFFIFMNSDFLLADGSLRSLIPYFRNNAHVVLAPSFRASEEAVLHELCGRLDKESSVLAIPPRELVEIALRNQHATVVSKTFNQNYLRSLYPNNLYWRVDNSTMLGHYFLLFMLVIRPQRLPEKATCFCDYSFVPEFCQDAEADVITDSDSFFMLELQSAGYESMYITPGHNTVQEAVTTLQDWTTAEHRKYARQTLVFHSDELPQNLNAEQKKFDALLDLVEQGLSTTPPRNHADHYYWHGAIAAWLREKGSVSTTADAEVIKSFQAVLSAKGIKGSRKGWLSSMDHWMGRRLSLSQVNTRSATVREVGLADSLNDAISKGRLLYVCDDHYLDAMLLPYAARVDKMFSVSILMEPGKDATSHSHAVCVLTPSNLPQAERILKCTLEYLADGGELTVLYRRDTALTNPFKSNQLDCHYLERICELPLADRKTWVAGGNAPMDRLMSLFARCSGKVRSRNVWAIIGACVLAPVAIMVYPWQLGRVREKCALPCDVLSLTMKGRKVSDHKAKSGPGPGQ
jgi:hypothetical protein